MARLINSTSGSLAFAAFTSVRLWVTISAKTSVKAGLDTGWCADHRVRQQHACEGKL